MPKTNSFYLSTLKNEFIKFKVFFLTNLVSSFIFLSFTLLSTFEQYKQKISIYFSIEFETLITLVFMSIQILLLIILVTKKFFHETKSIPQLVKIGETGKIEFKSSLRWDYKSKKVNKVLEQVILKTICAFSNSQGGTLLIGVNDRGEYLGLEPDFKTLRHKNEDGFVQHLTQLCKDNLGLLAFTNVNISMQNINQKAICRVDVATSSKPIFLKYKGKESFFIRTANISVPLSVKDTHEYIQQKKGWKN